MTGRGRVFLVVGSVSAVALVLVTSAYLLGKSHQPDVPNVDSPGAVPSKQTYVDAAWNMMARKDLDGAVRELGRAIDAYPGDPDLYNRRGLALAQMANLKGAVADYARAIKIAPSFPSPYNNRGSVMLKMGEYDRAIEDFTTAIRLRPSAPFPWINRAQAKQARGDLSGAILDYERALRLLPKASSGWAQINSTLDSLRGSVSGSF